MSDHEEKTLDVRWEKWGIIFLGLGAAPALALCTGVVYWAVSSADTAVTTANALATFNAQVMQRFDRIDGKIEDLPVMAEQLNELKTQMTRPRRPDATCAGRPWSRPRRRRRPTP